MGFIDRVTLSPVLIQLLLFTVFSTTPVFGQTFKYKNDSELIGAASGFSISSQTTVKRILAFCEIQYPTLKVATELSLANWRKRHQRYIEVSDSIRARVIAAYKSRTPDAERDRVFRDLEADMEKLGLQQADGLLSGIKIYVERGVNSEPMCSEFIEAIDSGKFDLKRDDPQLSKFFDDVIQGAIK